MFCLKYIIVDDGLNEKPIIFSNLDQHNDIAYRLSWKPVSAGFVTMVNGQAECYGESISLNIKSRPEEDSKIINRFLNN